MNTNNPYKGLTDEEVIKSRSSNGSNVLANGEERVFWNVMKEVVTEPMFILLIAACAIYFGVAAYREGVIMLVSIFIVAGISFFQDYRSRNAIQALNKLSTAKATVIRNGMAAKIDSDEIVVDDVLKIEEGEIIGADGIILSANDFSANESILTGESFAVHKNNDNYEVYKGTLANSGSAFVRVTAVGKSTKFGKIGQSLQEITVVKTPLQQQISAFVKNMVWIGAVAFLIVVGFNYYHTGNLVQSFLQGLTLAMSILPEEIPVAFSTFQALGAFRLLKNNIVVKQPQYVETLGSATVICTDKTGTLTQNKMSIAYIYDMATDDSVPVKNGENIPAKLLEFAMWSSETSPFDPMEKAIHALYTATAATDKRIQFEQVHEYPVGGKPPMMTHIFRNSSGETVIAAKGAPEAILLQSNLDAAAAKKVALQSANYGRMGLRVLGVGKAAWHENEWPITQHEFVFEFLGLIAFQDPPKENSRQTIQTFNDAGISVKMITGDYADTALAIASQTGLQHNGHILTGKEVMELDETALQELIRPVNIFARMFPEAKLKVINALKANGEVVAMTGDGVNDAPALKAAHIGVAMGQRGSEVAKNAAALILTDDDLSHMTDAVALGRKIYDNLKKAIQYIVSIHIPIILIVTLPLLLAWKFTDIFSPVHVIFLELIMGPTCSIIFENEPMEAGTMLRPPRKLSSTFLTFRQLLVSIVQGLAITAGCLGIGYYYMQRGEDNDMVRTVIFITLLFCNIFLTLVNRSFRYSIFTTMRYKNPLVWLITGITLLLVAGVLYVPFIKTLFRMDTVLYIDIAYCVLTAIVSTCWMEIVKIFR
ncbi:MAG: cation-translocating P-type ATPase [Ferruginibacter sp.]